MVRIKTYCKKAHFLPLKDKKICLDSKTQQIIKSITKYGGKLTTSIKNADLIYIKHVNSFGKIEQKCINDEIEYDYLDNLIYKLDEYKKMEKKDRDDEINNNNKFVIIVNTAYKIRCSWFTDYKVIMNDDMNNYSIINDPNIQVYDNYDITLFGNNNDLIRIQVLNDIENDMYILYKISSFIHDIIYDNCEKSVFIVKGTKEKIINDFNDIFKLYTNKEWITNENNIHKNIVKIINNF